MSMGQKSCVTVNNKNKDPVEKFKFRFNDTLLPLYPDSFVVARRVQKKVSVSIESIDEYLRVA